MQAVLIEIGLRRRTDRRQQQHQNHVSAHPVVLVHGLGIVHATVQVGGVVLREADEGLQHQDDVGDQAEAGVDRREVWVWDLVVDDDDKPGQQGQQAREIKAEVRVRAHALLGGRVRRLQDQDGLRDEEDAGGVEELEERGCVSGVGKSWGMWFRTGWAEKSISGLWKIEAQTLAAS